MTKILIRRGTATQWVSANPILGSGELGIETDTLKIKVGNGTSTWTQLTSYANITQSDLTSAINGLINAAPSALDTLNELAAAINNDSSFSTTVNNLLNGKVSKSGGDTITASSASTIPLILKAAPSQSASILEWQDSAGNTIGYLTNQGIFRNTYNYVQNLQSLSGGAGISFDGNSTTVFQPYPSQVILKVFPIYANQTGDLQQWTNSAGTVLSKINSSGNLTINGIFFGLGGSATNSNNISIGNSSGSSLTSSSTANVFIGDGAGSSAGAVSDNTFIGNSAGLYNYGTGNTMLGAGTGWSSGGGGGNYNTYIGLRAGYSGVGSSNVMIGYLAGQNTSGSNQLVISNSNTATPLIGGDFSAKTLTINGNQSIISQTASTAGLIVKAAASQTANLQEWQDSTGFVIARITPFGSLFSTQTINAGTSSTNLGQMTSIPTTAGTIGLVVRGAASQTADLQQWQNSSGSVLAKTNSTGLFTGTAFNASGYITANSVGGTYTNYWCKLADLILANQYADANMYMDFYINGPGFTYVPRGNLFVRVKQQAALGSAPETPTIVVYNGEGSYFNASDFALVCVQNDVSLTKYELYYKLPTDWVQLSYNPTSSVGVVNFYSSVVPVSSLPNGTISYARNSDAKLNSITVSPVSTNTVNLIVKAAASQTVNLQEWQNSSGTTLININQYGSLVVGGNLQANTYFSVGSAARGTEKAFILNDSASNVGLIVKAAASQSANLQEWQDSSGTRQAYISPNGNQINAPGIYANYNMSVISGGAGVLPFFVKGAASQTANLQEWQDSSGNVLTRVGPGGHIATTVQLSAQSALTAGTNNYLSASLSVIPLNASIVGAVIKGYSGQTADLQQWQSSDGTIRARINQDGHIIGSVRSAFGISGIISGVVLAAVADAATAIPLVVRAAASQTADLQQWQNSAGTVLAKVDSSGNFTLSGASGIATLSIGTNPNSNFSTIGLTSIGAIGLSSAIQFGVQSTSPSRIVTVTRGYASQTANLQEWQDSAGNVLGKVDASGRLIVGNTSGTIQVTSSGTTGAWPTSGSGIELVAGGGIATDFILSYNRDSSSWRYLTIMSSGTYFRSAYASSIPVIVQAAVSQTGNLQQWQDSAGTVLTAVNASGGLELNGKDIELMTIMGAF